MLEIIATIFMVSVGVTFGLVILAYAIYLTFYPLTRTVGGGLQVLKHFGEQRARAQERDYILIPDARLGFTMADGGNRIKKKRSSKNKK
jgi:hypothetical protein